VRNDSDILEQSESEEDPYQNRGYEPWDARTSGENSHSYTNGVMTMVQINAEDRTIVAMLPTQNMIDLMKACAAAALRFRNLKRALEPEMNSIKEETQLVVGKMNDLRAKLERVRNVIKAQGSSASERLKSSQKKWRENYKEAQSSHIRLRDTLKIFTTQLTSMEKEWIKTMRRVSDEHDGVLIDCGLVKDENESLWGDSDYEYEMTEPEPELKPLAEEHQEDDNNPIEHNDGADVALLQPGPHSERLESQQWNTAGLQEMTDPEITAMHQAHRDAKQTIANARKAHEDHRDHYEYLLQRYIRDQGRYGVVNTDTNSAHEYGPIYLSMGQQCVQDLRTAEEALLKIEKDALEAGISFVTSGDHAKVADHIAEIDKEGEASMQDPYVEKVKQWRNNEMDAVSLARTIDDELEADEEDQGRSMQSASVSIARVVSIDSTD